MRLVFPALLLLLFQIPAYAQLSGTYQVGSGTDDNNPVTDFASFTGSGGVVEYINANGLSGNTTLIVDADILEPGNSVTLNAWTGGHTLTITPDGSTMRTVSKTANSTPIMRFRDVSNLVIDGRDPVSSTGRFLTWSGEAITGEAFELDDAATDITIRNCVLRSSTANGEGIIEVNNDGDHDNLVFQYNLFREVNIGDGTLTAAIVIDQPAAATDMTGLDISYNEFQDLPGRSIYLNDGGSALGGCVGATILANSVYNTTIVSRVNSDDIFDLEYGTGFTIRGNFFGGSDRRLGGANNMRIDIAADNILNFIRLSGNVTGASLCRIDSNIFQRLDIRGSSAGQSDCYLINVNAGDAEVGTTDPNVIGDRTVNAINAWSIRFISRFDGSDLFCINAGNADGYIVENNTIGGIHLTTDQIPGTTGRLYGIRSGSGTVTTVNMLNNHIGSTTVNASVSPNIVTRISGAINGFRIDNTSACVVRGNTFGGLQADSLFGQDLDAFYRTNGSGFSTVIAQNTIGNTGVNALVSPNITCNNSSSTTDPNYEGIRVDNGGSDVRVDSNSVGGFDITSSTAADIAEVRGINVNGTVTGIVNINDNQVGSATQNTNMHCGTPGAVQAIHMGSDGDYTMNRNLVAGFIMDTHFQNSFVALYRNNGSGSGSIKNNTVGRDDVNASISPSIDIFYESVDDTIASYIIRTRRGDSHEVRNNSVAGIRHRSDALARSGNLQCIYIDNGSGTMNVDTNSIGSSTVNPSIYKTTNGGFSGINVNGGAVTTVNANTLLGLQTADNFSGTFYGIRVRDGSTSKTANNNQIGDNTVDATVAPSIQVQSNGTTDSDPSVFMMRLDNGGGTALVANNNIGGVSVSSTTADTVQFEGISFGGTYSGTMTVMSNLIGSTSQRRNMYWTNHGSMRGINTSGSAGLTVNSNTVSGIYGTGNVGQGEVQLIRADGTLSGPSTVSDNVIGSLSVDASTVPVIELNVGAYNGSVGSINSFCGIRADGSGTALTFDNNLIGGVRITTSGPSDMGFSLQSFRIDGTYSNAVISNNVLGSATQSNNMYQQTRGDVYGVYLSGNTTSGTVSSNVIRNYGMASTSDASFRGIYINQNTSNVLTVSNNTVGDNTVDASVSPNISIFGGRSGDAATSWGIYAEELSAITIENNAVGGIGITTIDASTTCSFRGIQTGGTITTSTIQNNTIGSTTTSNSIYHNADGTIYGILANSSAAHTISGNTIQNMVTTTNFDGSFYGMQLNNSAGSFNVSNNTITDLNQNGTGTDNTFYGIYNQNSTGSTISNNLIDGITTSSGRANITFQGLYDASANTSNVWSHNTVQNISQLAGSNSASVYGAYFNRTAGGGTFDSNMFRSMTNQTTGASSKIRGIYNTNGSWCYINNVILIDNGSFTLDIEIDGILDDVATTHTNRYYHNTVQISGSRSSGNEDTYAWRRGNTASAVIMRNNIFQNIRTGGANDDWSVRDRNSGGGTWDSDYNQMYSSNTSLTGRWGSTSYNFADWQTNSGGDANSVNIQLTLDADGIPSTISVWALIDNQGDDVSATPCPVSTDHIDIPRATANPEIGAYERIHVWTALAGTTDWFTPGNWSPTTVPTSSDNTLIPTVPEGGLIFPDIDATGAVCAGSNIQTGASVTISSTGDWTISGSLANEGTVTTTGNTLTFDATGRISGGGTFDLHHLTYAATADISHISPVVINLSGDWTNSAGGTYTAFAGSGVNFDGTADQSITNAALETFYNLTVNKASGIVQMSNDVDVDNALTITTGTLADNGNPLGGAAALNMTGGLLDLEQTGVTLPGVTGIYTITGGTVELGASAAAQTLRANKTYFNLLFDNTFGTAPQISMAAGTADLNGTATFSNGIVSSSLSNLIQFNDGATHASVGDGSHVDGYVRKVGDEGFTFPVGDDAQYQAIAMGGGGSATDIFTARYFEVVGPHAAGYDTTMRDPTLDHISDCEYWTLDRDNGSSARTVTLTWDANSCGVDNTSTLAVARWDGSMWRDHGNGGTTGTTAAGTVVSSGTVANFSPFTLASTTPENPLPIELISFDAELVGDVVDLNWATAAEIDNDRFVVERSTDGVTFEEVLEQPGAGNSSSPLYYFDTDGNPYTGMSYYRLRQYDFDGTTSVSHIVAVYNPNGTGTPTLNVYPNPATGEAIQVDLTGFDVETDLILEMRDMIGKTCYSKVILMDETGHFLTSIPLEEQLPAGIYLISATANEKIFTKKIVIR